MLLQIVFLQISLDVHRHEVPLAIEAVELLFLMSEILGGVVTSRHTVTEHLVHTDHLFMKNWIVDRLDDSCVIDWGHSLVLNFQL